MTTEWWKTHRPKRFEDMIGQATAARQLAQFVGKKAVPHALLFTGPSGCLRGDMPVYDPSDGSYLSVRERHRRGRPFQVLCLNESSGRVETAWAKPPVRYAPERIYRVLMSNGAVFYVTGGHQMRRASGGYSRVSTFASQPTALHISLKPIPIPK